MRRGLLAILTVSLIPGIAAGQRWSDPSSHSAVFVGVEPGVALEVLDWGGSGPPLLLLAGLGNTAHVFDEFAPHFTDRFHVLGVTRRGFGHSSQPESGYDVRTLATDIRTVLDRLDIQRVVLIGHSIAGDELTKFASTFSDRVSALVYLDAAYDRTRRPKGPGPEQRTTASDLASVASYNAYAQRTFGIQFPENEVRAMAVFDAAGRILRAVTPTVISDRVLDGIERPDYKNVRAPALAIYQPNDLRLTFPNYEHFDEPNKVRAEAANKDVRAWAETSINQFRTEVVNSHVAVLETGSHYVFLTNEDEVARLIREFLDHASRARRD